ncbi:Glutamate or tyrosine decarboxylase [Parapedobacter composti]|uniref:Glutamate or tyrosine decarboxylase n=1 Tax=Parapedobacter composti TaxID=623281 RepID=A0A1I1FK66_9SPHI|nr:aminotransferase class V-fold PLP-dependent enzyme [Parapedobacter composti]SFB99681.1 Glutamate or tyrosine decarboxylase [Parapedobacter composti]
MSIKMHELDQKVEEAIEAFTFRFRADKRDRNARSAVNEIDEHQIEQLKHRGIPNKGRAIQDIVNELVDDIFAYGVRTDHPRFFGFIPGPASRLSWLGDIMTSAYNIHAGSWANGPAASCIEQELIHWLCQQAGYGDSSGGLFVSGGSMANMTALIAARDKVLDERTLHLGVAYVSDQSHSSVMKGLRIIGIPSHRIRTVATDTSFRMDSLLLRTAIEQDLAAGLIPFAVIATAGTTNTGSIDPLRQIAAICQEYGIWMHVDGAYGASVMLSLKYRHLLDGIGQADSISWDGHKWLFQTYGCAMVLVKDKMDLIRSFHVRPEYLKDLESDHSHANAMDLGVELTRPARGLRLWLTLQGLGSLGMSEAIEHGFQLAAWAEDELRKKKYWEIVSPAQLAIVNFRYAPADLSEDERHELNQRISKSMIENGYAGVFTTELHGKKVLRICAIHPETTESDVRNTVRILNQYALEFHDAVKR